MQKNFREAPSHERSAYCMDRMAQRQQHEEAVLKARDLGVRFTVYGMALERV